RVLSSLAMYDKAVEAYDQALKGEINPDDKPALASIWANKGVALWQLKQYPKALESTNKAIELNPESFEGWYNQGVILVDLKKYSQALAAYDRANRISPNNVHVLTGRGIALAGLSRYQDAIAAFEEALNIDPNYTLAQQNRDRVLRTLQVSEKSK
ncbi:MAG TPA: tetratricopeptide repeat protein, partial [Oculatellaceae cyanobacterium]